MAAPVDVDVAVVGGGPAGIAAALAAARRGARTLLAERDDRLGGNASQAFVHTLCGLYHPAGDGPPRPLHPGLPSRFARELGRRGAAAAPERAGRVFVLPADPRGFAELAHDLCAEARGLRLETRAELARAELARAPGAASRLHLAGPSGELVVRAGAVIDASGDAATAAVAGAAFEREPAARLQRPSYIVRLGGLDTSGIEGFARLRVAHAVTGAARAGRLPPGCESVLVRPALAPGEAHLTLNLPALEDRPYEPLEPAYRTALEDRARSHVLALLEFLRDTRPAFRNARVVAWPARIGIRETRRLRGEARVEAEDVLGGRLRDDEVARSAWPIELWEDHRRPRLRYATGPCSIPLGALVSRSHPMLGMAGRCLSASHEAHGALRVIGTALATGEAAGVAAALAVDAGSALRDVAPAAVRAHIASGADPGESA